MNHTLIPVEQALKILLEMAPVAQQTEVLDLLESAGRVLAEDVISQVNVPPADNSSMDGYALRYQDRLAPLPVSQRIGAGHPALPLKLGTCARIFTGGEIPAGADLVVMQEAVSFTAFDDVVVPENLTLGQNIRPAGQDIRLGDKVVCAGTCLDYRHLGLLASVGVAQVKVFRRVKVVLLSTGDELVMPGTVLQAGQIYNSHRFLLQGYLEKMGAEVVSFAQVADSYEQTLEVMRSMAAIADVILSTGGVSVGEEDHVKPAVEALGELSLWRLAMKPGKPLAFGRIGSSLFMGLPGNPVSTFVGAQVFVEPLLRKLSGEKASDKPLLQGQLLQGKVHFSAITQARQEYLRVQAVWQDQAWQLYAYANQSSGVLSSTVHTNALAIMPPQHDVSPGDQLDFWFY